MPNEMLIPRQGEEGSSGGIPGWDAIADASEESARQTIDQTTASLRIDRALAVEPRIPPVDTGETGPVCCPGIEKLFEPDFFKALADPARIDILVALSRMGRPCTVGELAKQSPRDLSVVSRHLRALRDAGVANSVKKGKQVYYWVRVLDVAERMRAIADSLHDLAARYSASNEELCC